MRGRGRGRGRVGDLEEPLLEEASLSSEEARDLDALERRKISAHVLLVVLLCLLDVGVTGAAEFKTNEDAPFSFDGFDMTTDLTDAAYLVLARGIFQIFCVLAVKACSGKDTFTIVNIGYWVSFSVTLYGVGKLIALDWSSGDFDVVKIAGVFGWIAFGIAQLVATSNLLYWMKERKLWIEKDLTTSHVDADAENNGENENTENENMEETGSGFIVGGKLKIKQRKKSTGGKGATKSVSTKSLLQILKPYFWPHGFVNKLRCIATWVFLGLSKAANLMSPIYIGKAVQELSDNGVSESTVFNYVIVYSILVLSSKVLKEMQNVVYLKVKQIAYEEIAAETFAHLHALSLEWHLKKKMGNVLRSMDRGVAAANTLVTYLFLYLGPSIGECVVVFVIFYSHFSIPTLSATAFVAFVAYTVITVQITMWRKKFREQTNKHDNDYHDKATDSLINYETVKYFTAEKYEIDRYTSSIKKYQKYSVSTAYSLSLLNSLQNLVIQLCTCIGLCIAAHEVRNGRLQVGQFVSVSAYIANLFAPLSFLGSVYNVAVQSMIDLSNLQELLEETPDLEDAPNARQLIPVPNASNGASIEFRNVVFHYPTQPSTSGLQGLSFKVDPGTSAAIVGHTGEGKSTIFRLLFRFYDPLAGKVLISGQDIKYVTQLSLRKSIGVVPQDTVLFNDTILHNITYGMPDVTMEQVERACESAQLLDFIKSLPDGFNSMVGERGLKLSGGEKQRCAIIRVLLKNPPILIADEATSALDQKTERSIQAALKNLASDRTTITIAHRLTTISDADQIMVLKKGQIVERGKHSELLGIQDGMYAELWKSAMREDEQENQKSK